MLILLSFKTFISACVLILHTKLHLYKAQYYFILKSY